MTAKEFFNLGLRYLDEVNVVLQGGGKVYTGIYAGIRCVEGTHLKPECGIFPVFYRRARNGGILRRSIFGDKNFTFIALRDLLSVSRVPVPYRLVGRCSNPSDCYNFSVRGVVATLRAFKDGEPAIPKICGGEIHEDIRSDNDTVLLDSGKYAVRINCGGVPASDFDVFSRTILGQADISLCSIEVFERVEQDLEPKTNHVK